jgi:hypothetical protein
MDAEEEIPPTFSDVSSVVVKVFISFLWPLTGIAILFSFLSICVGYVRQVIIDPPEQIMVSISMINDYNNYPVLADAINYNSKLLGKVDLYLLNSNGCNMVDFQSLQMEKSEKSMIMIAQGSCPSNLKIVNAELAGFSSVFLYNERSPFASQNVSELKDFNMMILSADSANSRRILRLMSNKAVCPAVLNSNVVIFLSFRTLFLEIAINLFVVYLAEFLVLTAWLIIYTGVNIVLYRNFRINQSILNGCMALVENSPSIYAPKLQSIPFPEKTLTEKNIEELKSFTGIFESDISSYHDSCGICLEEFQVRNKVRSLPCRHLFHSSWYFLNILIKSVDRWLLDYNRLCPTCQQDVLKSAAISRQRNIVNRSHSESDVEESLVSRHHSNSIKLRIARWIKKQLA